MGSKIALEGLVLLLEGLELVKFAVPEVIAEEHVLLAGSPGLVNVCLVVELFGQMFQSLQSAQYK